MRHGPRARAPGLTFTARSPLDEDHRRLLQLQRAVADALQLADVAVGHAVAPAHCLGAAAHAHAGGAPPSHGGGHLDAAGHLALHALGALLVSGAAARLALARRAHRAAVAAVQHVPGQAVGGDRCALGLVAALRTANGGAFDHAGRVQQRGGQGADDEPEPHDGVGLVQADGSCSSVLLAEMLYFSGSGGTVYNGPGMKTRRDWSMRVTPLR